MVIFWPKINFLNFEENNFGHFFAHFIRIVLQSFCSFTRFHASIELCRLTRLIEFLTKNRQTIEVFGNFWSEKSFSKKSYHKNFRNNFVHFLSNYRCICLYPYSAHHNTYKSHFSKKRLTLKKFSTGNNFQTRYFRF